MVRKLLLLLCIAFVVIGYAYPCVVLPVGTYNGQISETETRSYKFGWGGMVDITSKVKNEKEEQEAAVTITQYYKLKGDRILICENEKFEENVEELQICSIYKISGIGDEGQNANCTNIGSIVLTSCVGFVAVLLILSIPSKRKIAKDVEARLDRKKGR